MYKHASWMDGQMDCFQIHCPPVSRDKKNIKKKTHFLFYSLTCEYYNS